MRRPVACRTRGLADLRLLLIAFTVPVLLGQTVNGCGEQQDDDTGAPSPSPAATPAPVTGLIELVAPFNGQVVATEDLFVFARLGQAADSATVHVSLDGVDITEKVTVDPTGLTVKGEGIALSPGPHLIEARASDNASNTEAVNAEFSAFPGGAIAKTVEQTAELIDGPEARGRIGDLILYNGRIQMLFSNLGRPFDYINVYGGHLLDADRVRAPWEPERDAMGGVIPAINIESTDNPTSIEIVNDGRDGGPAVLRTRGPDDLMLSANPSSMAPLLMPAALSDTGLATYIPASADDRDIPVEITNTYTLAPGDDYITFETSITNTGSEALPLYFGDYLNSSGEVDYFVPGQGFRQSIYFRHEGQFIAYAGFGTAKRVTYGIIPDIQPTTSLSLSGTVITFMGQDAQNVIVNEDEPATTIPPGESFTYRRWLAVVEDIADVTGIRCQVKGESCAAISGRITQGGTPVAGAEVALVQPGGANRDRTVITHWRTRDDGTYAGVVPLGTYTVMANIPNAPFPGSSSSPPSLTANVRQNGISGIDFDFPMNGLFEVEVVDESRAPIPAKITLVGFDPSADPLVHGLVPTGYDDTGAVFSDVFMDPMPYGVARVALAGADGKTGRVAVEPGDYYLFVSHGPYYSISQQRVTIPSAPQVLSLKVQIARVIESDGFVSGDFHVHGIDSFDSGVPRDFRLTGLAAEGVDVFATTDHGIHVDTSADLARLGLGRHVVGVIGEELTTTDLGHFNAFPMAYESNSRTAGGTDWGAQGLPGKSYPSAGSFDLTPSEIADKVFANAGDQILLANHINTPSLGYFSLIGLDTAKEPPQAVVPPCLMRQNPNASLWTEQFTALELWRTYEDSSTLLWDENLGDWFNLINQGILRTSLSDSDTHSRYVVPAGGPRNLFPITEGTTFDSHGMGTEVVRRIQEGRVINTNAPILNVELESKSTGQRAGFPLDLPLVITSSDGRIKLHIGVKSAIWAPFDEIQIFVSNMPIPEQDDDDAPGRTYPHSNCASSEVVIPDLPRYKVVPDILLQRDVDFSIETVVDYPEIPGAAHLEADVEVDLEFQADSWVVVLARGTEGVSAPIFPMLPDGLNEEMNQTLEDLVDGNVGEGGILTTAFTNPLYVDIDGNGTYDPPGVQLRR